MGRAHIQSWGATQTQPDPTQELRYVLDLTKSYNDLLMTSGAENQNFVWGNELLVAEGENPFAYITDQLGSPIRLVGGEQEETLAYDEFGVPVVGAGAKADAAQTGAKALHNPFGFTGYQTDDVSGLCYAQARYYSSGRARFVSVDPVKDQRNWYGYCGNNPFYFIDPTGLNECEVGKTGGAPEWLKIFLAFKRAQSPIVNILNFLTPTGLIDGPLKVFGFEKDADGVFHVNQDAWQKYLGYNNFYDWAFNAGTDMRLSKFEFATNDEKFMIWMWKGDYINLGAGAETGIYYGEGHHWTTGERGGYTLPMTLEVTDKSGNKILTYQPNDPQWWITGFNPAYPQANAEELRVVGTIDFSSQPEMWEAFSNTYGKDKNKENNIWELDYSTKTASYEW